MGEVFAGRYELVDPIGRGGVGAVWRAWDHRRKRYVAAKVLQQSDAFTLLRFIREQAMRIDHPHVLAPASWAADDDKVLFTMDLVGGGSLAHLIGDYGPLPPAFVCTLLDQLLSGLAAVHAEGVVHRDIKPANVLLEATGTRRPHLRLSDFGISMRKGEPRLTDTNFVVGTPGYFAPEQIAGSEPDFPADLFAVGLVALYLLSGAKPDAKALVEHFTAHGTPPAPKDIPEPLWQVLAGLLQPDPESRFRTATGARKALTHATEMLPAPGPDDELVEVFDQIGPLPMGFGPQGPLPAAPQRQPDLMPQPFGTSSAPAQPPSVSGATAGSFRLPPPPAYGPRVPDGASFTGPSSGGPSSAGQSPTGQPYGARDDQSGQRGPQRQEGSPGQQASSGQQAQVHEAGPGEGAWQRGVLQEGTFTPSAGTTGTAGTAGTAGTTGTAGTGHPMRPGGGPGGPAGASAAAGTGGTASHATPSAAAASATPAPAAVPPVPTTAPAVPAVDPSQGAQSEHPSPPHHPAPQPPHPASQAYAQQAPPQQPSADVQHPHHPQPTDPSAATTPAQRETSPTRPYTAQHPQIPQAMHQPEYMAQPTEYSEQAMAPHPDAFSAGTAPADVPWPAAQPTGRAARRKARQKKPGPPAKVAIPMLLVALLCFAVGTWALLQP